ncbi:DUF4328 domain-containing protein [Streptomyces sp. NPDC055051]
MLRNPDGLAYAVMALLGVDVFLFLSSAVAEAWLLTDPTAAAEAYVSAENSLVMVAALAACVSVATAVVFIVWFHRVRQNAGIFAPDSQTRSPGWAVGAWFIPLANLWIPRQIAVEIWRGSRRDPSAADGARELTLLNAWWTCFVVGLVLDRVSSGLYDRAETLDALTTAAAWSVAGYGFIVTAGVLGILFVHRLTSMQHAKATGMLSAAK